MISLKQIYDVSKTGMTVVGTGYVIHKIYAAVEYVVSKASAVKTALAGTPTVAPAAKTVVKS
jgi:hypothetical protein